MVTMLQDVHRIDAKLEEVRRAGLEGSGLRGVLEESQTITNIMFLV